MEMTKLVKKVIVGSDSNVDSNSTLFLSSSANIDPYNLSNLWVFKLC